MNVLDIIEAVNGLEEDLLAESLTEEIPAAKRPGEEKPAILSTGETSGAERKGVRSGSGKHLPRWLTTAACLVIMALAGVALSGSGRVTAAEDPQAETHMLEDYWIQSERQKHASVAANHISQTFYSYGEHGMTVYPDDCGDMYIDGEMLVLCLKDPDEAMIDKYLSVLGDGKRWVRIRAVKYSRNELQVVVDEMYHYLTEQKIPWYMCGVDVEINGIWFGTDSEYVEIIEQLIKERYPDVPARVVPTGPIILC